MRMLFMNYNSIAFLSTVVVMPSTLNTTAETKQACLHVHFSGKATIKWLSAAVTVTVLHAFLVLQEPHVYTQL